MKKITLLMAICLMFSINAFSRILPAKQPNAPHSNRNLAEWSNTKRVPEKWNATKIQSNAAQMSISHQKKQQVATNSQKAVKQYLDSLVGSGEGWSSKDVFLYDNSGNPIGDIYYEWDGSNWIKNYKSEYTYDGNQIVGIAYEWNNNDWVMVWKIEDTYDSNGNLTKQIGYEWDGSEWIEDGKYEWTYDANGNLTEEIYYKWDNSDWRGYSKNEYTYDGNGNLTEKIDFYWDGNDWKKSWKTEWTYDGNGNPTEEITYSWYASDWEKSWKTEWAYDGNGNITLCVSYFWDGSDWEKSRKYECTYNVNGNLITMDEIHYVWDYENNDWRRDDWKWQLTYDLSYSITDLVSPYGDNWEFTAMWTEWKDYIWDGTDWIESRNDIYYWSSQDVGIVEKKNASSLSVYPNPTTGQLKIENGGKLAIDNMKIFDIYGRNVYSFNYTPVHSFSIDISHLPTGIYFLWVGNETVKILKE